MKATSDTDERRRPFRARDLVYRRLGQDRVGAARFVVSDPAGQTGPALDVGIGKGLCAVELARVGLEIISIDPDGDEQGLELAPNVHPCEGREHPRAPMTIEHAAGELEAAGFRRLERTNGYLHDVVVLEKRSGQGKSPAQDAN